VRYTRAFIPTLKEAPKDAQMPSHILMLRGGFMRQVGAGIYELLPLGHRVTQKVAAIVREEMNRAGAHEITMPALLPAEYFEESGRWDTFGDTLFRLKDRKGARAHLGPTHEEIVTDLVRREVRSYKQLPLNLYQVQTKFRDEPRPRAGLLRCREFVMKDAYSFDADEVGALKSYEVMREAYHCIFKRVGLDYRLVAADSGAMGGSTSAEFQVLATTGEDAIVACDKCDYAANVEVAEAAHVGASGAGAGASGAGASGAGAPGAAAAVEKVSTPGVHTVEEVVAFFGGGTTPARLLKSLVYVGNRKELVLVVVRGDDEVNETKLARALGVPEAFLAGDADVERATGAKVGFAGPVGFKGRVLADPAVAHVRDAITGANATDAHLKNVNYGRDFQADLVDLRRVKEGDSCPRCQGTLKGYRGIEGGHIFVLGTHYSAKMGATFLDESGKEKPLVMGCYGIGVTRLVATAIEQHHDDNGIDWPMAIAPYHVIVTPLAKDGSPVEAAERIYAELTQAGIEVLLDDRDERAGVKFKDADLLGIPVRITVGARALAEGVVEVKRRADKDAAKVPLDACVAHVRDMVRGALSVEVRA
jgi:prolyl-tRNA synthetase